jgi:hypothetical protein
MTGEQITFADIEHMQAGDAADNAFVSLSLWLRDGRRADLYILLTEPVGRMVHVSIDDD